MDFGPCSAGGFGVCLLISGSRSVIVVGGTAAETVAGAVPAVAAAMVHAEAVAGLISAGLAVVH